MKRNYLTEDIVEKSFSLDSLIADRLRFRVVKKFGLIEFSSVADVMDTATAALLYQKYPNEIYKYGSLDESFEAKLSAEEKIHCITASAFINRCYYYADYYYDKIKDGSLTVTEFLNRRMLQNYKQKPGIVR